MKPSPVRRLWPYLRRYRRAYVQGLILVALASACGIAAPLLIREAIDRLERQATREAILLLAAAIVLFALVRGALIFASRTLILGASRRIERDFRSDLYAHLETLPARYYDTHPTGDLTSRAVNDIEGVRLMIGLGLMWSCSTGLTLLASVAVMFLLKPALAALCLVPLALITVSLIYTGTRVQALSLAVQDQLGVLSSRAQENFSGARVVRAFAREEGETERYAAACAEYRARSLRLARWRALSWALILLLAEAALVVTLVVGGRMMMAGTFSKGDFAAFAAYELFLIWPMIAMGWIIHLFQRGAACMGRLSEILEARPEIDDASARPLDRPIEGRIEARGLTFSYSPDRPPALADLRLTIEPGQRVAFVGRTGAGKSTLASLLLRLYPVPDGTIFVDGRDLNTIPAAELRRAVGLVPQDLFLFSDRLRENIAFGSLEGADDSRIERAAEIARLAPDAALFPDRYDTMVGERGVTLSGGQKQRTALARALIRDPRILILDDALSSVDAQTEREIRERLRDAARGQTTILITHRLSSAADADRIFVLDGGRLVEEGRHEELVARGGLYAALWEGQKIEEELTRA
jgi:ATP-binding cassette subfamily B protein